MCQEDHSSTASASQLDVERGNCGDTCVDAKVPYARRVGEEETSVKRDHIELDIRESMSTDLRVTNDGNDEYDA